MEILKEANRMMNAPAGCYFPSLWLLQSLFSSYILRRLFSPETLVSHHKIIQFYCVGGGWNLAMLGSNTGADLGECILRVVWMSLVQNQSLLSRQKTIMLTVISVGFKFQGEVGELLKLSYLFSRTESSFLITSDYWALYNLCKASRKFCQHPGLPEDQELLRALQQLFNEVQWLAYPKRLNSHGKLLQGHCRRDIFYPSLPEEPADTGQRRRGRRTY